MSRISIDEFDKLTNTGKHRAITDAELRAEKAEGIISKIKRYLWGIVLLVFESDELIENVMRVEEKTIKQKANVVK